MKKKDKKSIEKAREDRAAGMIGEKIYTTGISRMEKRDRS